MRGGAFFNGKEGRDDFRKTAPEGGYILPFSRRVSVPCEGNRKGRKAYCGLVRMWSSLWLKGDGGIRKNSFFNGKNDANERNESWLSNCRVQLAITYLWE